MGDEKHQEGKVMSNVGRFGHWDNTYLSNTRKWTFEASQHPQERIGTATEMWKPGYQVLIHINLSTYFNGVQTNKKIVSSF